MKRLKVRHPDTSDMVSPLIELIHLVDENLYYMGIDKKKVDPARLSQTHGVDLPTDAHPESARAFSGDTPTQPPYLFHSGDSLIALTEKHNVRVSFYGIFD